MTDAESFKAQGNAALSAGNFQEAIDQYTKAIEINPANHVYYSNRSAAYLSLHDAQKALEDAEKCIEAKNDWAKGYSRKGAALHTLKKYEDAKKAYEQGLEVDPSSAPCKNGLDEVEKAMASSGSNPLAGAFGPDMFAKLATNPRVSHLLSDASFVSILQEIQQDPNKLNQHLQDQRVMQVLGELLGLNVSSGDEAQAQAPEPTPAKEDVNMEPKEEAKAEEPKEENLTEEEKEQKAQQAKADEAKARGNSLYKQKKFDEAIECYNEAIELYPSNISYYTNLAAVKLEQKKYDECIEDCKKAVEIGRSNRAEYPLIAKAYVRIGNAYTKKGETEENLLKAIENYENAQMENRTRDVDQKIRLTQQKLKKAKELAYIDPEKAAAAKAEGNEFFKSGSFPEAVERYTEAIKRDPSSAVYYANRAAAYTKLTSFVEAKSDCEKALKIDPNYVKAWTRLAAIQFLMKEYHKARESYESGLKIDPENEECKSGLRSVANRINSGEVDEERAAHGMADPEIQAILRDPVMQNVLQEFQTDPQAAQRHLQNADIMAKIEKLIAAGVLQTK